MGKTVEETKAYLLLTERNSPFIYNVKEVVEYAETFLPKINRVFSNYTGHGIEHSINVMEYMFELCDYPELLSDLEIVTMIYSALLHDMGMVVSEEEIQNIKNDTYKGSERKYSMIFKKFENEIMSLQEFIRPIHGKRSLQHILEMDKSYFIVPNNTHNSFQEDVAKICAAHNEDFCWLTTNLQYEQVKGKWSLNPQYIAMLLRIADYLDIDEERTPTYLYEYIKPRGYGDLEWRQHFVISNEDKIIIDTMTGKKNIVLFGESSNPEIHRKLLKYIDFINGELLNAINYSNTFHDKKYLLTIGTRVQNKIRTVDFDFSDFKLTLDYNAVTGLLMGENIYGDKKYGLRELLQNSIDACMVMLEKSKKLDEFNYNPYSPSIKIILNKEQGQAIISDNGTGMSMDILKKYFLNVGISYYVSDDYQLQGNEYRPIGNYGIGFLSCFMLSDKVSVATKYYSENKVNRIDFEKSSEYICLILDEKPRLQGTEIILDYDQFMKVFEYDVEKIKSFISTNFMDCSIPIAIIANDKEMIRTIPVILKSKESFFEKRVTLTDYFDDIEIFCDFNYKNLNYLNFLSDLKGDINFLYDDEDLISCEEYESQILLKNYIKGETLSYLRIPIVPKAFEDKFNNAYEVFEEYDKALYKVAFDEAIVITKDDEFIYEYDIVENGQDSLVGNMSLAEFRVKSLHSDTPAQVYLEEMLVIEGNGDKVLPYEVNVTIERNFFEKNELIYVKNVLISSTQLKIPFLVDGVEIKGLVVNSMNKNLVPNVSRTNISESQNRELSYAIGKAIHQWIYENGNLENEERSLIKSFLDKCYSDSNQFFKK